MSKVFTEDKIRWLVDWSLTVSCETEVDGVFVIAPLKAFDGEYGLNYHENEDTLFSSGKRMSFEEALCIKECLELMKYTVKLDKNT